MDSTVTIDILWACFKSDGGLVSFRKFFDSMYAPLCRYAYLIVKDRMDAEDISYLVREAICSLPPKCKEVFSRSRSGGLSNEQIASEMGISVKTVEAHMTRALKTLRIKLKKMYFFFFML